MYVTGDDLLWYLHCPAVQSTVLFNADALVMPMDLSVRKMVKQHSFSLRDTEPESQQEVTACNCRL